MRNSRLPWPVAAFCATALLGGCVGEPQTFHAAPPMVLQPRPVAQASTRSVSAKPALSTAEKQRLFQAFQRSQDQKASMATVQENGTP